LEEGEVAMGCKDSSAYILEQTFCLYDISKTVREGTLRTVLHEPEHCPEPPPCDTLKTVHQLDLELEPGPCDSPRSSRNNGRLYSCDLTHALNGGPDGRGFHGGSFTWAAPGFLASGTLSGITNAGTQRDPIVPACQECRQPLMLEGRFCGVIRRASNDPGLLGCQVFGAYRLQLLNELTASVIGVKAVLEGLIVCECRTTEQHGAA
jgi:hypothetical protein